MQILVIKVVVLSDHLNVVVHLESVCIALLHDLVLCAQCKSMTNSMHVLLFFRLESIAVDAELQEKSLSELERLADILHESCAQAESEHMLR